MRRADFAPLREAGLDDAQIVEVAAVAAYFNFINRVALGWGVRLDAALEGVADPEALRREAERLA